MELSKEIENLRNKQHSFYRTGVTHSTGFRRGMLEQLRAALKENEPQILKALYQDLHKSEFEAYSNEIGLLYREISVAIKKLKKWQKKRRVLPEPHLLPGSSWIQPEPYGSVLIMAPWNYPIQLLFMPLVGAMAAGNTVVLKPSEIAPATAKISQKIIQDHFSPEYLSVVQGGPEVSQRLIDQNFDYLFFTGSVPVGKKIMQAAAEHLTPLTLELGGKSPAIVASDADLDLAARKIVWGKFNNAGQTCVAPDYVLADQKIIDRLIKKMQATIRQFYGDNPAKSPDYGRIISEKHFDRLCTMMNSSQIIHGGQTDAATRYVEPTLLHPITWQDAVMQEEIFGPILPILPFSGLDDVFSQVENSPKPLALYVFSEDRDFQNRVLSSISFGGGAVNTTVLHVASHRLPFGGVGPSGTGRYHGKASFDTFTHYTSILRQSSWLDPGLMYPHKKISLSLLRRFLH
jgi:aldehyde dehydrogenase (NAD+)